jgi:hypothetical protein
MGYVIDHVIKVFLRYNIPMANSDLHAAKKSKNDEFYTQMKTIEDELRYYKDQFKDKTVFCNCDDPLESNFVKYFALQFEHLGLKKLVATHYIGGTTPVQLDLFGSATPVQARIRRKPYVLIYEGDKNGNRNPDIDEFEFRELMKSHIHPLNGTGDFRSPECTQFLKEADIVVTNPPFSLFREYVAQLVEYDKKFLIIGNTNAITYKEIFKLIKQNKLWLGQTNFNVGMFFEVPDDWGKFHHVDEKTGRKIARVSTSCWFTNLDTTKRHEIMTLYKKYSPEEYPKYDNYDAINVDKVADMPADYEGDMGVPVTFLDKYNPEQFEIIGLGISSSGKEIGVKPYKPEHRKYRKEVQKRGTVDGDLYMMIDGIVTVPYARIIIKQKEKI